MLQIDALLTFAIGASLASAAGDGLKATHYHTQNKYFVYTLLHLVLIVAPFNVYMLWEHTGFETMFYYDASIHGIWPALNIPFSTLSGIAGFMAARKLVRMNRELMAYSLWTSVYTVTLAIVSSHYDRFLFPGGIREFYEGKTYTIKEYLNSELCQTLTVSLFLTAAPVFYAQICWPREEGYMTKARKSTIKWHCAKSFIKQGLVAVCVFSVLKLVHLTPAAWGWDRALAIGAGQMLGFVLLLPVFLISTRYVVTPRIDIRRTKQNQQPTRRRRPSKNSQTSNAKLYNMNEESLYADWEELNVDDDQESTSSEIKLNGNGRVQNGHYTPKQE